jgi:hypothetical protein
MFAPGNQNGYSVINPDRNNSTAVSPSTASLVRHAEGRRP